MFGEVMRANWPQKTSNDLSVWDIRLEYLLGVQRISTDHRHRQIDTASAFESYVNVAAMLGRLRWRIASVRNLWVYLYELAQSGNIDPELPILRTGCSDHIHGGDLAGIWKREFNHSHFTLKRQDHAIYEIVCPPNEDVFRQMKQTK